ncbi:MAG: hypothetical protein HYX27_13470 [Acidobacteria bacterium]|nr:hypothetical protein [Acidobacteriota bacterium]
MWLPKEFTYDPTLYQRVRRTMPDTRYYFGLDLGQRRDFSALATFELTWRNEGRCPVTWELKFVPTLSLLALDRFPLGTDYTEIPYLLEDRMKQVDAMPRPYTGGNPMKDVVVDGGGPGPAVVESIRCNLGPYIDLKPIIITGGHTESSLDKGYRGVPRRTLISNLLLMIANNSVKVPRDLDNREELETEFANLRAGTTQPEQSTAHDDLVLAVAMGAWGALSFAHELVPKQPANRENPWRFEKELIKEAKEEEAGKGKKKK